jgi:hypothetical protein
MATALIGLGVSAFKKSLNIFVMRAAMRVLSGYSICL